MTTEQLLMLVARWLHIVAAALAVGVPLYARFVELPAMDTLPEGERSRFRDALAKRWRMIVYVSIVVFLATGFYTFLGVRRWQEFPAELKARYHLYFGIKLLLALGAFFISSALAGRSAKLAPMRAKAGLWLAVLILLVLLIVVISGTMRFMDAGPSPAA